MLDQAGTAFLKRDGRDKPGHDLLRESPVMTAERRHAPESFLVKQYYVYILASRPGGDRTVGVTNNLIRRVHEHRNARVARQHCEVCNQ